MMALNGRLYRLRKHVLKLLEIYTQFQSPKIGVVISSPRNYMHCQDTVELFYWVYDVMIGDQLITDVPQEFIDRMIENEKDIK